MSKSLPVTRPSGLPKTCSDKHLYEAVKAWLQGESPKVVAEFLNVPVKTLGYWVESHDWHVLVNALRIDLQGYTNSTLGRLQNMTLKELEDRLTDGDEVLARDGSLVRIKIKARDLASIAGMLFERKEQIERKLDGIPDKSDSIAELFALADRLRAANAKEIQGETQIVNHSLSERVSTDSTGAGPVIDVEATGDREEPSGGVPLAQGLRSTDSGG